MKYHELSKEIIAKYIAVGALDIERLVHEVAPAWASAFPFVGGELSDPGCPSGCTFDSVREHRTRLQAIAVALEASDRGTWATISQRLPTGDTFTDVLMANGRGGYVSVSSSKAISANAAKDKLIYSEVHEARRRLRGEQAAREANVMLGANGWRVGSVLKGAEIRGKRFEEAAIAELRVDGTILIKARTRAGSAELEQIYCHPSEIDLATSSR